MDCRIVDSNIVVRDGSIVSVPPNHFGINKINIRYYGTVVMLVHNDQARVKWYDDNSVSVETLETLKLETAIPLREETEKKKKKFEIRIKPTNVLEGENNIQFQPGTVAEFQPEDTSTSGFVSY